MKRSYKSKPKIILVFIFDVWIFLTLWGERGVGEVVICIFVLIC